MPCYRPLEAWQLVTGEVVFSANGRGSTRPDRGIRRQLDLPCGQCVGCRLERSRQWAVRCMHEASMHDFSSFVTLTYDDDHVPSDFSLNYRHFQLFSKRLRKAVGPFRFYMCGEYGDNFSRPHFHACLFGVHFNDRTLFRESNGTRLYRSQLLESLWKFGYSSIGDVTFESAAYVARYVMKKVTGKSAEEHYTCVDAETGEVYKRTPEFSRMSLKPGIGVPWFERYKSEVFPSDSVIARGVKCKPPRRYFEHAKKAGSDHVQEVEYKRYLKSIEVSDDNTSERLAVKHKIAQARSDFYKRQL